MTAIDEALKALQLQKFPNCTKAANYLSVNYITLLGRHRPLRGHFCQLEKFIEDCFYETANTSPVSMAHGVLVVLYAHHAKRHL